jgi:hypothetical protein
MKRKILIIVVIIITSLSLLVLSYSWDILTNRQEYELTNGIHLTLLEPKNGQTYDQIVPLTCSLTDPQGLGDDVRIQFSLKNEPKYEWTDELNWTRKNSTTIEIQTKLAFISSKIGPVTLQIRISNGTVFSDPIEKKLIFRNYFY